MKEGVSAVLAFPSEAARRQFRIEYLRGKLRTPLLVFLGGRRYQPNEIITAERMGSLLLTILKGPKKMTLSTFEDDQLVHAKSFAMAREIKEATTERFRFCPRIEVYAAVSGEDSRIEMWCSQ